MEEAKLTPEQEKQYLDSLQRSEDWTVMADKLRDAMDLNGFEYALGCVMNYEAVKVALPKEVELAKKLIKIGFEKIESEKVKNGN